MLQPKDKVAIYMEGHLESDFGKMGFGAVRYLANDIVAVIDSSQAGEVQIFNLTTRDQGVTWYGYEAMKNDPAEPGLMYLTGYNNYGELGQNDTVNRSSPIQIPGTSWSTVRASGAGTVATKTDGTLWVWGYNTGARSLGLNNTIYRSSPTQIPGTQWETVQAGNYFYAATKTDGTFWMWGQSAPGRFGNNTNAAVAYSSPKQVPGTQWAYGVVSEGSTFFLKNYS